MHFSGYGLGWMMSSYRGHYRVEHGGGIDGFITTTGFFPSDSIGIFVVSNQGAVVSNIRNFIADRMLNLPYRNWPQSQLEAMAKAKENKNKIEKNDSIGRKFNTKPSHDLDDYTGTYSNKGYGAITITKGEKGLESKFNSLNVRLDHFHYDQFDGILTDLSLTGSDPIRFNFHINTKGDIHLLTIPFEAGTKDIEFEKEVKVLDVKKDDLKKFEGEYELAPGRVIKFYIKGEKTLYAFIEGQPEYELVPTAKNTFDLKVLKGFSAQFEENEKGELTAVNLIQPNGTFKANKIK